MSKVNIDKQLEADKRTIAKYKPASEKISWNRKREALEKYIREKITPIDEQILELELTKQPHRDVVAIMSAELLSGCVHPYEFLVHRGTHVSCSFCGSKLSIPAISERTLAGEETDEEE